MKRKSPVLTILILLSLLSACDMSGNLLSPSEKDQLYSADFRLILPEAPAKDDGETSPTSQSGKPVRNPVLADGSSLKPGASFTVSCSSQAADVSVSAVIVSLEGAGAEIASVLFLREGHEPPAAQKPAASRKLAAVLDAPLPVSLPEDLSSGAYGIRARFYDKNALVFEKLLEVFVLSAPLSVDSVQVCPASASPGSVAFLQASVDFPADSRPYLVWRYDESVIASGLLSDGFDRVFWTSPEKEGIYAIMLSVYPFPPKGDLPFGFESPASRSAKVVVAVQKPDPADPFQDPSNYLSLLRFQGGFDDSGYRPDARKAVPAGPIRASALGASYGYQLDAERSLAFDEYLLPVKDGKLGAFTLMGRFMASKKTSGGLFRSESAEPGFSLSLELADSGQFQLVVSNRSEKAVSASGIATDGRVHDIAVSVIPVEKGLRIQWFLDYVARPREDLALDLPQLSSPGRASFGGQGAAMAVYDEFGVYAAPVQADALSGGKPFTSAWTQAFGTLMAKTYRDTLIQAEGFEEAALPKGVFVSGAAAMGSGALALGEKSAFKVFFDAKKDGNVRIDLALRQGGGKDYALTIGPKDQPAVSVMPDGSVRWLNADGKASAKIDALDPLAPTLRLEFSSGRCNLVNGKQAVELFAIDSKSPSIAFGLESRSPVEVESLLIRRLSDVELLVKQDKSPRGKVAVIR